MKIKLVRELVQSDPYGYNFDLVFKVKKRNLFGFWRTIKTFINLYEPFMAKNEAERYLNSKYGILKWKDCTKGSPSFLLIR